MAKLFDEEFLKKLEYLYLLSKKLFAGKARAHTRTKKMGWGMEFADYRDYAPGDDPRYLDWNLYARMEQLATKLFHEEENLNVHFLLDASRSMDFGDPKKFDYARKVVAALAYVALSNHDAVSIQPFGAELAEPMPVTRGKGRILAVFDYLENLKPMPSTDMAGAFSTFLSQKRPKGLAVVVSDFWDEAGYERALKSAYSAGYDLAALCLHHHYEAEPKWRGAVVMTDAESGRRRQVTISGRTLRRYRREYEDYLARVRVVCHSLHCHQLYAQNRVAARGSCLAGLSAGAFRQMIPNGISWSAFAALYGALAAVIAVVFLLRFARRGRAVSSTLIWQKVLGARQSFWKEVLSFLMQLILVGLLALALVDPRPKDDERGDRYVAVVIDASESMNAEEGGATRLALAVRGARELLDTLAPRDRAMIVKASATADALTPFTASRSERRRALENLRAFGAEPALDEAVALAVGAVRSLNRRDNDEAYVVVFTDRPDRVKSGETERIDVRAVAVGETRPNLAVRRSTCAGRKGWRRRTKRWSPSAISRPFQPPPN
ncbi:MAG: VWA domain-containing protein [Deltaproteobacteria bacterium]|nr:VWA domain-containing protein [Deltaproteobacteria bacterium]